ncbi:hypothetical protein [Herminiimonas arsenitoxidans]|uniref:hypothetical protein n=1 Tax=Herminiimonas arsenitoxidans TaxID=1809410 RepID=UPI0009F96132|nr:hypothetical protein [Herminiimonas arsenitoxidans]
MKNMDVSNESLILQFRVEGGDIVVLDIGHLELPSDISLAFKRAILAHLGHTALSTKRQAFLALKKFSVFLIEERLELIRPLPKNILHSFRDWLVINYKVHAAKNTMLMVTSLLAWCRRNVPGILHKETGFIVPRIFVPLPMKQKTIDGDALKNILSACYAEIEVVEANIAFGKRLFAGEVRDSDERRKASYLLQLLDQGCGDIPEYAVCRKNRKNIRLVDEFGGIVKLNKLLWLSSECVFPFYLAILIQTSGNPEAILRLEQDCISPHPLRNDLENLKWEKGRSRKEQRVDFPTGKKWSSPSIIRLLMELTASSRLRCAEWEQKYLFLTRCRGGTFGRFGLSNLNLQLHSFIKRNQLPQFTLRSLRASGAVAHHRAGGSMESAKSRLNHMSLGTTAIYTDTDDLAEKHDQVIRKFQGELVRISLRKPSQDTQTFLIADAVTNGADTVFGFRCKDPYNGIASGSKPGSLCKQFMKCATCPGALIPLDDVKTAARLLDAYEALNVARARATTEGWWQRYKALYESTYLILQNELIPAIDKKVKERALTLSNSALIPWIE